MMSWALNRVPVKPIYNTIIDKFISPLPLLYLQNVLLIHLEKCVFNIIDKSKLTLRTFLKDISSGALDQ